ncbi:hypothetical protein ACYF6T_30000 [Streptomyces sp. 7R007]
MTSPPTTATPSAATPRTDADAPMPAPFPDVREIVDATARLLTEHYASPEVAEHLAALLRRRLAEGAYDVRNAEDLAALVTADLRSVDPGPCPRLTHDAEAPDEGWTLRWDGTGAFPGCQWPVSRSET